MPTGHISKRSIDARKPENKDSYLWDDELSGFGLKVTPAGRKVYLVQYRLGGRKGRVRRVTIGIQGRITPEQARIEAKRLLGQVAAGEDPADLKQQKNGQPTLGELVDVFLSEYVDAKLKASTAEIYRRLYRDYLPATLCRRFAADVSRPDIARLHVSMRDKPYQANRVLALLSKFFNWCEKHGYRPDGSNPCRHIEKYKEQRRERFLSPLELARLGDALAQAEANETTSPYVIAALRLLVLTGARLSEILTLQWSFIDFDNTLLRLPDSKTGAKTIYLNAPALQILTDLPRLEGNPFVICGKREGARLINLQKPWRRIRKAAGLDDVRIHDLRHSFASVAAGSGQSLPVIGALLGHTQPGTTARYAHLAADPLRAASD
ncbi:MAG: site-specific integrase, partial [Hyphomicrobiales bacterium]|nr:site-specific integrase [Hyphomicrobiales bacterium]